MASLRHIEGEVSRLRDDQMREVCLQILKQVGDRLGRDNQGLWTLQTFSTWVGRAPTDDVLFQCVQFLTTQRDAKLLDMHFIFHDEDDPDLIGEPIDDEEVKEAYRTGFLVHPETGSEVRSFEEYLLPYFVPNAALEP